MSTLIIGGLFALALIAILALVFVLRGEQHVTQVRNQPSTALISTTPPADDQSEQQATLDTDTTMQTFPQVDEPASFNNGQRFPLVNGQFHELSSELHTLHGQAQEIEQRLSALTSMIERIEERENGRTNIAEEYAPVPDGSTTN